MTRTESLSETRSEAPFRPPRGHVGVRMYRNSPLAGEDLGGLGDCFLLALPGGAHRPYYLLIDCGLFQGSPDIGERLRHTMRALARATGGHLDAVVLTHQHYDHLSGFKLAWEDFRALTVGSVWLAWTEDPDDGLAQQLRQAFRLRLDTLRQVARQLEGRLEQAGLAAGEDALRRPRAFAQQLREVLNFAADGDEGGGPRSLADVMGEVAKRGQVRYCRPGESFTPDGAPGVRVYVLGPPRDLAFLRRSDPSRGAGSEVYLDEPHLALGMGVRTQGGATPEVGDELRREQPFEPPYQQPTERYAAYLRPADEWRRIDLDWYQAAGELALKLDGDTNNTSLVLAFELPDGQVLLFPGDAQVGNWLSWHRLRFRVGEGDQARAVTAAELLARTVLYKVGHHGSHNATLKAGGLERMTHPDLVALLPVNEAFARTKSWEMPYGEMYRALEKRTRGRILRADRDPRPRPPGVGVHRDYLEWVRAVLPGEGAPGPGAGRPPRPRRSAGRAATPAATRRKK